MLHIYYEDEFPVALCGVKSKGSWDDGDEADVARADCIVCQDLCRARFGWL